MATLQGKPAGLDSWVTLSIDLHADTWTLFGADGNCRYGGAQPDFSLISAVIIEFGGWSKQRPGPGLGVVQVKDFRLVDRATPAALTL